MSRKHVNDCLFILFKTTTCFFHLIVICYSSSTKKCSVIAISKRFPKGLICNAGVAMKYINQQPFPQKFIRKLRYYRSGFSVCQVVFLKLVTFHEIILEHLLQIYHLPNSVSLSHCIRTYRSSHPEVFLGKGVLKICGKFTGEHPC